MPILKLYSINNTVYNSTLDDHMGEPYSRHSPLTISTHK
ncbi:hypothetical protein Zm00014a_011292 [Zea mays]|uniref:Uncharacterized protein n=1 Tax=Zea mays TaxID=4577 RepID=A0A3L6DXQ8_MAIZE|nr:hypothetical protein Zm00014a_011292 [Zea mays]